MNSRKYIDRDDYCRNICRCVSSACDKAKCPLWKAIAKDVIEVVRCKDCRFSGNCGIEEFWCNEPNDYCSRGKKKENCGENLANFTVLLAS